ncbi:hypothetical protein T10_10150 [Trichinella papuae]|uniref:Uncharacterized protein n=1 Tax=Trichinella papuae TaxID=268474 RepID=A0A0V1MTD0_9BILA|nr:hypothetical protein T10_4212 [Trichinella papuae]KRZ75108.1 hypothetical protein T10_10150 [Trichinella papuae]
MLRSDLFYSYLGKNRIFKNFQILWAIAFAVFAEVFDVGAQSCAIFLCFRQSNFSSFSALFD